MCWNRTDSYYQKSQWEGLERKKEEEEEEEEDEEEEEEEEEERIRRRRRRNQEKEMMKMNTYQKIKRNKRNDIYVETMDRIKAMSFLYNISDFLSFNIPYQHSYKLQYNFSKQIYCWLKFSRTHPFYPT